jgi:nucleoside-diphosphate-sugar epimerase
MTAPDAVVFGGAGFLGRPLVRRLAAQGLRVRVVSRRATSAFEDLPTVTCRQGDVSDARDVDDAVLGAGFVFLMTTGGGDRWADFERDVVRGASNVARASSGAGVRRVVYTSSIAALYLGGRRVIDESTGPDPHAGGRCFYTRAKIAAEGVLHAAHRERKLPVVVCRPGLVMGQEGVLQHAGVGYWASETCCIGWGPGDAPLPFVLVDDVAEALCRAMSTPDIEGCDFNLVAAPPITAAGYVQLLAELSRRPFRFYARPVGWLHAIDAAKWAIKVAARKPENAYPSLRELKSRTARAQIDCSRARSVLGWSPATDLDLFLRRAVLPHIDLVAAGDLRLAGEAAA